MDLSDQLPRTPAGSHVALLFLRSATAAAPNYAEARGAENARDFLHKLGVALKELNEAEVRLDMIMRKGLLQVTRLFVCEMSVALCAGYWLQAYVRLVQSTAD
jgi:four helix bundle protein